MRELLFVIALIGIISIAFMVGYIIGKRRTLRRPDVWNLQPLFVSFDNLGKEMRTVAQRINWAFMTPSYLWNVDPTRRVAGEHPIDWIQRVGLIGSGYNVRPGEYWRFRELRDWWEPDSVPDEYGQFYQP